jgi:hypothetical protein
MSGWAPVSMAAIRDSLKRDLDAPDVGTTIDRPAAPCSGAM